MAVILGIIGSGIFGYLLLLSGHPNHMGIIDRETRQSLKDYIQDSHLNPTQTRQNFAASGRIMCPNDESSAFLIFKNNIVITAKHVVYPTPAMRPEKGKKAILNCSFETTNGRTSQWHKIDVHSFVYLDQPRRHFFDRFDWIVMRLEKPILDIAPYHLPRRAIWPNEKILNISIRQTGFPSGNWNQRIVSQCHIRDVETIDSIGDAGFKTDCAMSGGASGSAILRKTEDGFDALGLASAGRLNCRSYQTETCFTHAIGISQPVQDAIKQLAASSPSRAQQLQAVP